MRRLERLIHRPSARQLISWRTSWGPCVTVKRRRAVRRSWLRLKLCERILLATWLRLITRRGRCYRRTCIQDRLVDQCSWGQSWPGPSARDSPSSRRPNKFLRCRRDNSTSLFANMGWKRDWTHYLNHIIQSSKLSFNHAKCMTIKWWLTSCCSLPSYFLPFWWNSFEYFHGLKYFAIWPNN